MNRGTARVRPPGSIRRPLVVAGDRSERSGFTGWRVVNLARAAGQRAILACLPGGACGAGIDLASFVHDPGISIEVFAAEPDVVDPVALCFDARGACYVVEMRDYPEGVPPAGAPGGTVRVLRDSNGDGRADTAKIFAESLSFPTSVTAWRRGILVMAPPDVIYLEDGDGDDHAERREVVLTGLRRGVTDGNANGLRWGPDNRMHAANGGHGGRIRRGGPGDNPEAGLDLRSWDFSFDPDSREVSLTGQTGGGFGIVFDSWGRCFTTENMNHLQERVIPEKYLAKRAGSGWLLPVTTGISAEGTATRIFPVGPAVTRVNHPEQAGHFSAACGPALIDSPLFGAEFETSILICDAASRLVHREKLDDSQAVSRSQSVDQKFEFIASREMAFRPTGLEPGPDGALYLIDMQRDVIEHPDYIPDRVKRGLDLRAGSDRGRIYRVTPRAGLTGRPPSLAGAPAEDLVRALGSPIPWVRQTAHRLLIEQAAATAAPAVRELARQSADPRARVRALWVLDGLRALEAADCARGLEDPHAGVRANAVQLAEKFLPRHPDLVAKVASRLADDHARVRFQSILSLTGVRWEGKAAMLADAIDRDAGSEWVHKAAVLCAGPEAPAVLELLATKPHASVRPGLIESMARAAAATGDTLDFLERSRPPAALVRGLAAGLKPVTAPSPWNGRLARWAQAADGEMAEALFRLVASLEAPIPPGLAVKLTEAARVVADANAGEEARVRAAAILGRGSDPVPLLEVLATHHPPRLQQAAVGALTRFSDPGVAAEMIKKWRTISPVARPAVIDRLVANRGFHEVLVSALERGDVTPAELNLDLEQRRALLRTSDEQLAKRIRSFVADEEYANRKSVVDALLAEWPTDPPNLRTGFRLFIERCQMCHTRGQIGNRVGPDLLGLAHRSVEDLLTQIVDPNLAINPAYVACTVATHKGDRWMGLLKDESADSVTVVLPLATTVIVPRAEIESIETSNRSLMPEGLESGLLTDELHSLIAFLQSDE